MAVVIKPGSHVAKYAWITIETINRLNGNEIQKKFLNCIPQESRGAPIWYVAPTSNRRDASKLEVKSTEYGGAKNEFRALSCLLEKILDEIRNGNTSSPAVLAERLELTLPMVNAINF